MPAPGLSQSALDFVSGALRLLNVLASGEQPQASEAQDALVALNQMVDSWNNDRLAIYTFKIEDFPFVAGQQSYTMGKGGNFNTDRPVRIERCSLIILNNPANPLELSMHYTEDESEWQDIQLKNVPSTYPLFCYDQGDFPRRTLNFWPKPLEAHNFRVYSWEALSYFADLTTLYSFPPGYAEAIRYNLAIRIADEYGAPIGSSTALMAVQSFAKIKSFNVTPIGKLKCGDEYMGQATSSARVRQELFGIP